MIRIFKTVKTDIIPRYSGIPGCREGFAATSIFYFYIRNMDNQLITQYFTFSGVSGVRSSVHGGRLREVRQQVRQAELHQEETQG